MENLLRSKTRKHLPHLSFDCASAWGRQSTVSTAHSHFSGGSWAWRPSATNCSLNVKRAKTQQTFKHTFIKIPVVFSFNRYPPSHEKLLDNGCLFWSTVTFNFDVWTHDQHKAKKFLYFSFKIFILILVFPSQLEAHKQKINTDGTSFKKVFTW